MNNNVPPAKWIAVWLVCAVVFLILVKCGWALTPSEREIVTQAQSKIVDLRGQLEAQQKANDSALASQTLALTQISGLIDSAKVAADAAAMLTAERDGLRDKVAEKDAVIAAQKADKKELLASFHTFKFYTASTVAALVALLAGLLIFRFMAPALNTPAGLMLAFGAPAAIGAAVFTLIITR